MDKEQRIHELIIDWENYCNEIDVYCNKLIAQQDLRNLNIIGRDKDVAKTVRILIQELKTVMET